MPCRCDDYPQVPVRNDSEKRKLREQNEQMKEILDKTTQNLCYLIGELKKDNLWDEYRTNNLTKWSKTHDDNDHKRVSGVIQKMIDNGVLDAKKIQKHLIDEALKVHDLSDYHRIWFLEMAEKKIATAKAADEALKNKAKIKKEALSKLTNIEKEILGIKE
jgi:hypothetical protein